jgi:hypothetical protein
MKIADEQGSGEGGRSREGVGRYGEQPDKTKGDPSHGKGGRGGRGGVGWGEVE